MEYGPHLRAKRVCTQVNCAGESIEYDHEGRVDYRRLHRFLTRPHGRPDHRDRRAALRGHGPGHRACSGIIAALGEIGAQVERFELTQEIDC
jgi:hypothetical protein